MPSFEEIEAILNASWYLPPSKCRELPGWDDEKHINAQVCPYCGARDSFFSGAFLAWQCNWCDGIFDLEEAG